MIKQNIAIYSIPILYNILKELEDELNYDIIFVPNKAALDKINFSSVLLLTDKKNLNQVNILELNFPLKISKLVEKINIQFMKFKSKENSNFSIGNYMLNLNSRELILDLKVLNLTEKEVNLIMFLNKSSDPVNVERLQFEVWGYGNKLETHTVETHIHRLRKKIFDKFKKDNFILNAKNGYYLNKLS